MTVNFTRQGCKVETTYAIQPNGAVHEHITLSTDPASALSLAVEERSQRFDPSNAAKWRPCPKKLRR